MAAGWFRFAIPQVSVLAICLWLTGCGGGDNPLENQYPGNNDLNVVVAFGDSLTLGSECPCVPYPARLGPLIGKFVHNLGVGGSTAASNAGRTQQAINKYHPAFMLILYGINDVIHGNRAAAVGAISQMVAICKQNHVVPVLATYPLPITGHLVFSGPAQGLNKSIRGIASAHGIKLVDLEYEFHGDPALYMPDGLHPNDAGTQIMALAFADLF